MTEESHDPLGSVVLGACVGLLCSCPWTVIIAVGAFQRGMVGLAEAMLLAVLSVVSGALVRVYFNAVHSKAGSDTLKPKVKSPSDGVWDRDLDG